MEQNEGSYNDVKGRAIAMLQAMRMSFDAIHGSQKFYDSQTANAMKRATARYIWVKGAEIEPIALNYQAADFAIMLFGLYDKKGQVYAFEEAIRIAKQQNKNGNLDALIIELTSYLKIAEEDLVKVGKDKKLEPIDTDKKKGGVTTKKEAPKAKRIPAPLLTTYTGVDMVATIEIPGQAPLVFAELASIQYSCYRETQLTRALGRVTPKGVARGSRTISGVLTFIEFDSSIVYRALKEYYDVGYRPLMDEMPLFDITLSMANESGQRSVFKLYGLSCYSEGAMKSIDMMTSSVAYEFYALDLDPTAPLSYQRGA